MVGCDIRKDGSKKWRSFSVGHPFPVESSWFVGYLSLFHKVAAKSPRYIPVSTDLGPILFTHAVQTWANVVITQGFAQGVSNIGPCLGRVRKQYWAKIVQNNATRDRIRKQ